MGRPRLRISGSARPQGLGLEKGQRRHLDQPRHKQAVLTSRVSVKARHGAARCPQSAPRAAVQAV